MRIELRKNKRDVADRGVPGAGEDAMEYGGEPLVIITLEDSRSQSPEAADFNFN